MPLPSNSGNRSSLDIAQRREAKEDWGSDE
jgi:hypothetical protein